MGIETVGHPVIFRQLKPAGVKTPSPSWGLKQKITDILEFHFDSGVRMPTPSWGLKHSTPHILQLLAEYEA